MSAPLFENKEQNTPQIRRTQREEGDGARDNYQKQEGNVYMPRGSFILFIEVAARLFRIVQAQLPLLLLVVCVSDGATGALQVARDIREILCRTRCAATRDESARGSLGMATLVGRHGENT